jgi:hypothetical protein
VSRARSNNVASQHDEGYNDNDNDESEDDDSDEEDAESCDQADSD